MQAQSQAYKNISTSWVQTNIHFLIKSMKVATSFFVSVIDWEAYCYWFSYQKHESCNSLLFLSDRLTSVFVTDFLGLAFFSMIGNKVDTFVIETLTLNDPDNLGRSVQSACSFMIGLAFKYFMGAIVARANVMEPHQIFRCFISQQIDNEITFMLWGWSIATWNEYSFLSNVPP